MLAQTSHFVFEFKRLAFLRPQLVFKTATPLEQLLLRLLRFRTSTLEGRRVLLLNAVCDLESLSLAVKRALLLSELQLEVVVLLPQARDFGQCSEHRVSTASPIEVIAIIDARRVLTLTPHKLEGLVELSNFRTKIRAEVVHARREKCSSSLLLHQLPREGVVHPLQLEVLLLLPCEFRLCAIKRISLALQNVLEVRDLCRLFSLSFDETTHGKLVLCLLSGLVDKWVPAHQLDLLRELITLLPCRLELVLHVATARELNLCAVVCPLKFVELARHALVLSSNLLNLCGLLAMNVSCRVRAMLVVTLPRLRFVCLDASLSRLPLELDIRSVGLR